VGTVGTDSFALEDSSFSSQNRPCIKVHSSNNLLEVTDSKQKIDSDEYLDSKLPLIPL
jgi:hypothetical protein